MRTIKRISAAFLLPDCCNKQPVRGASILVDGSQVRYDCKGDGHYVFTDLPPDSHEYEISAPGYRSVVRSMPVKPAVLPDIVPMQYHEDNPKLMVIPHFRLRFVKDGSPIGSGEIRITLLTAVGSLRVIDDAAQGVYHLSMSGGYSPMMLYQQYVCEKHKGAELMFTGFDKAGGAYLLDQPLGFAIPQGTLLRPVWKLQTNRDGVAILPVIGQFMQRDELEFSFECGKKKAQQKLSLPDRRTDVQIEL